ncbi:MAG: D-alanine--D-alanine ligase, partial [Lachnospiraceae bacterium]|nr:D-alanine--D-alanine ligase [Lachnospiraceae bacterium]
RYEGKVLVEQYIEGRELTDCVIEGKALPIVEIVPLTGFYDYKNKYQAGSTTEICPAQIGDEATKKIQELAVKAYHALGIQTYARMDFIMTEEGEVFCLEANTLPGMTPVSLVPQEAAAIGKSFNDLCEWILEISLKKYE